MLEKKGVKVRYILMELTVVKNIAREICDFPITLGVHQVLALSS